MTQLTDDLNALLSCNCESEVEKITKTMRQQAGKQLQRRGVVVGVSGGVDSAVCVSLAAKAFGAAKVQALLMPEQDFDPEGTERAKVLCDKLGVKYAFEDIGPILEAFGCYQRRDDAIRKVFPEYGPGYRQKVTIAEDLQGKSRISYFNLVIKSPDGEIKKQRMPLDAYLQVIAATNMKQRTRKQMEYYYAEQKNYAVLGTPNRLEYELGFFVRGGDGLADIKPIAHLYKTQVYELASYLEVPQEITSQPPSTDTYSLPQTQEEFYFALPYDKMDQVLYAYDHGWSVERTSRCMDFSEEQINHVYQDILGKKKVAKKGLQEALLMETGISLDVRSF